MDSTKRDDSPRKAVAKRRIAVFLLVTFALTWGLIIAAGLALDSFSVGELGAPAVVLPITVSMFFPLVGALVANRCCGSGGGIDLRLRPNVKGNLRAYLAAWLVPAAVASLGFLIFFATFPDLFDPMPQSLLQSMSAAAQDAGGMAVGAETSIIAVSVIFALTVAPFVNMLPAFGEEAGWRGLLFPSLCELMPPRAAVLASGLAWGIWHTPIIAMGHHFGMGYAGFPWTGVLVMVATCTAMGSFLSLLRTRAGSVWPCALAHGAFNATANIGLMFCAGGQALAGPSTYGYVAGIPLFILGVACWLKTTGAESQDVPAANRLT